MVTSIYDQVHLKKPGRNEGDPMMIVSAKPGMVELSREAIVENPLEKSFA